MPKILIPLPTTDFDPTEVAVPWKILTEAGFDIQFATPDGDKGACDDRMLNGKDLGLLTGSLGADPAAARAYRAMAVTNPFSRPLSYRDIEFSHYDGVILPGGHAPGMKTYLESDILQKGVAAFFSDGKPLGAICHGVVLAARSQKKDGESILFGKKVTALPAWMELSAYALTCFWLGRYYRTYRMTVEDEVRSSLRAPTDFDRGPLSFRRDREDDLSAGFVVRDRNLLTARWPGDAHLFSVEFQKLFEKSS